MKKFNAKESATGSSCKYQAGLTTYIPILSAAIICIFFGCNKSQQAEPDHILSGQSPWVRPADARLTIEEVARIARKTVEDSKYRIDDYNQGRPHWVVLKKGKYSWQVDFSRKDMSLGSSPTPPNVFMVFIADDTGKVRLADDWTI